MNETTLAWTPERMINYPLIQDVDLDAGGEGVLYTVREAIMTDDESAFCAHLYLARRGGEPLRLTYGTQTVSQPRWSPDGRHLAFLSNRVGEVNQLYVMNATGGESWPLTAGEKPVLQYVWSPRGDRLAFVRIDDESEARKAAQKAKNDAIRWHVDHEPARLWLIPFQAGDAPRPVAQALTPPEQHVLKADWALDGQGLAYISQPTPLADDWIQSELFFVSLNEPQQPVCLGRLSANADLCVGSLGVACVVGQEPVSWATNNRVVIFPLDGGAPRSLAQTADAQPFLIGWSADGQSIYFMEFSGTATALQRLPADGSSPTALFQADGFVSAARTNGRNRIAMVAQDSQTVNHVALLDIDSGAYQVVAEPATLGWKEPEPAPVTEVIHWSSGPYEIEGLLTLPVGYVAGHSYPTLVIVHGGPAGAYSQTYVGAPSPYPIGAFAERGYAVLRANPRGSSGYGAAFRAANRRDWGVGDYADIMTGLDLLIERGVADPERLGIMGWSYGGYMTSWTITQTDRFKAASVGAGVTNLMSFTGVSDITAFIPDYFGAEYWQEPETYAAHSAMFQVGGVTTPTLIQHGGSDVRVPLGQGKELYTALERQGVSVEMIIYPRQGHGLAEPRLIIDAMQRNLGWFDRWLLADRARTD